MREKAIGLIIAILTIQFSLAQTPDANTLSTDTAKVLDELIVTATTSKQRLNLREEPLSATSITLTAIEQGNIERLTDFSNQVPNLYIPDYGSKITSSIYVRGIGSRIDNPAVGMYVDDMPILNKNAFDLDLWDIMRLEILRGPQSTLFGRNTIGGIINVYSLSPRTYQGTRISLTYGNANTYRIKASTYQKINDQWAVSLGANYNATDGFFINNFDHSKADWQRNYGAKARVVFTPNSRLTIDNSLTFSQVDQGGYAYHLYNTETGLADSVNYNDKSGYKRTIVTDGLSINYNTPGYALNSVTSWQYLDDCMSLDQDFTPKNMFTMQQAQHEHTLSQEFTIKTRNEHKRWQWITGAMLFYKNMTMHAPVLFKQDGINELILDNINKGIHQALPEADMLFKEEQFYIHSDFKAPIFGAALYHQSELRAGNFNFTAGLRLDYEHSSLDYHSHSTLNYLFTMTMKDYKELNTQLRGKESRDYVELLPKLSVQYLLPQNSSLYATLTKGYKSGGFNTQMFSDILQTTMKSDLLGALGITMDHGSADGFTVAQVITYKPEHSWNMEVGTHLNFLNNKIRTDMALFYILCTDQQLTIFPDGQATGRMMTNAGRTRSWGAEASLFVNIARGLNFNASYGYTNAKFTKYNNGKENYAGNYIPYSPQNTLYAGLDYSLYNLGKWMDIITFRVACNGIGQIYWNEQNTVTQPFYSLLDASIFLEKGKFSLELWAKNLTNTKYNTFYFVSVGNAFLSQGNPLSCGGTLNINF